MAHRHLQLWGTSVWTFLAMRSSGNWLLTLANSAVASSGPDALRSTKYWSRMPQCTLPATLPSQ